MVGGQGSTKRGTICPVFYSFFQVVPYLVEYTNLLFFKRSEISTEFDKMLKIVRDKKILFYFIPNTFMCQSGCIFQLTRTSKYLVDLTLMLKPIFIKFIKIEPELFLSYHHFYIIKKIPLNSLYKNHKNIKTEQRRIIRN